MGGGVIKSRKRRPVENLHPLSHKKARCDAGSSAVYWMMKSRSLAAIRTGLPDGRTVASLGDGRRHSAPNSSRSVLKETDGLLSESLSIPSRLTLCDGDSLNKGVCFDPYRIDLYSPFSELPSHDGMWWMERSTAATRHV